MNQMHAAEMVLRHGQRRPNTDAIIDVGTGRRLSHRALRERTERLAGGLHEVLSVGPGSRVAILSRNSVEYLEMYLATSLVGAILQPLNWRLAANELANLLDDVSPQAVIYHREFREVGEELQRRIALDHWIEVEDGECSPYEELIERGISVSAVPAFRQTDPIFLLYTGGSTGRSKGVIHTHRSLIACTVNESIADRIRSTDVYLLMGQMYHIPVVKAWTYLAHGRSVVLMNFNAESALRVIEAERVTGFIGITTMLQRLLAVPNFDQFDLQSLRVVQYGGGPMPERLIREALERLPADLIHAYGQTEGGSMTFLPPEIHQDAVSGDRAYRLASCGLPAFLSDIKVVDDRGDPVPRDRTSIGEVLVRSSANMLGYWKRPELTEETLEVSGWMRTGDLAQWDTDGLLYIVGRSKNMIISGGENIYPAQIERVLTEQSTVSEAIVVGVPDEVWGERVVAVVVPKGQIKAQPTDLESQLIAVVRDRLASYMKPSRVLFRPDLPETPAGKIDRSEVVSWVLGELNVEREQGQQ